MIFKEVIINGSIIYNLGVYLHFVATDSAVFVFENDTETKREN